MDKIALAVGSFLASAFEYLEMEIFTEMMEWIGHTAVGYGVIFIMIALIFLVFITQRKGRR